MGTLTKARAARRTASPRYEPVLQLPALSYEDFTALHDSIAVNGILIPIVVDSDGPVRKIIDGNYRKRIAEEFGYDCPETVLPGLTEEEKRLMARALNLARRQLTPEQKRRVVGQQLTETPERANRWIGKQLGVHHATVASVRAEMQSTGQLIQLERTVGRDGKYRPSSYKAQECVVQPPVERRARTKAATLMHGDCRREMKKLPIASIDAIITDPIYPEVDRSYGRISEADWHDLMRGVVAESRRVLKPKGSAVFILQPNAEKVGTMRLWLWEFVVWAAKEWNLVQDVWWWAVDAMPLVHTSRKFGLMRPSVKMCVWLGPPDCHRNQGNVLWTPSQANSARHRSDIALRINPSGRSFRNSNMAKAADERGGTTPFNLLPIPTGGNIGGREGHPAATPYELARWWCKYILPPNGVLLDMFCGSGTMLQAGLDEGASKVVGIDREKDYLKVTRRRIEKG